MNFKALALAALTATSVGFAAAPAEARVPLNMIGHCVVGDPHDSYANFRRSPNGALVKGLGNGTYIGSPAAQSAGWTLFNAHGWIKDGLFSCEVMS